ncbi:MAG: cystathionine beta-lyase [Lautropia sp.]
MPATETAPAAGSNSAGSDSAGGNGAGGNGSDGNGSDGPGAASPGATAVVGAGRGIGRAIDVVNVPVWRASSVLFDSVEAARAEAAPTVAGELHRSTYGTAGTATTYSLMDAVAELEGQPHACRAALMPSGLTAIGAALLAFTKPGDHLLMSDSVYGPARVFANGLLARFGVRTTFFDPLASAGDLAAQIESQTRVIYLESPGSYTFEIQDTPAICALARARGVLTMIDNTYASPCLARPFDWGVDISLLALTKYWGGHSDLLMGAVVTREAHWQTLWATVKQLGLCVGGDDAWLVLRGLRTVNVRMPRHQQTALAVARWLETRPEVGRVLHPGLPTHPQHALFRRDFLGSNGLFSFELRLPEAPQERIDAAVKALCNGRRHFSIGYSWGGFESLIMPAMIGSLRGIRRWTGGPLIRLHCGLEDPADLIADLAEGLDAAGRALG